MRTTLSLSFSFKEIQCDESDILNENILAKDRVKIYLKNKAKGNSNTLLLVITNLQTSTIDCVLPVYQEPVRENHWAIRSTYAYEYKTPGCSVCIGHSIGPSVGAIITPKDTQGRVY